MSEVATAESAPPYRESTGTHADVLIRLRGITDAVGVGIPQLVTPGELVADLLG